MMWNIDPMRIADRHFGGPHFAAFVQVAPNRIKNLKTGDVFDTRGLADAWMEGRNMQPIIRGDAA